MKKEKGTIYQNIRAKRDLRNFQIFNTKGNRPERMILQEMSLKS